MDELCNKTYTSEFLFLSQFYAFAIDFLTKVCYNGIR